LALASTIERERQIQYSIGFLKKDRRKKKRRKLRLGRVEEEELALPANLTLAIFSSYLQLLPPTW